MNRDLMLPSRDLSCVPCWTGVEILEICQVLAFALYMRVSSVLETWTIWLKPNDMV